MGKANNNEELLAASIRHLVFQNALLQRALPIIMAQAECSWRVVLSMAWCLHDTVESLVILGDALKVRDSLVLSRVATEVAVNTAYVCATRDAGATLAEQHARQKDLRELVQWAEFKTRYLFQLTEEQKQQVLAVGRELVSVRRLKEADPALAEALTCFTSRRGDEITSWSKSGIRSRLPAIEERYGAKVFRIAVDAIYRDSSEVIHGTFYGYLLSHGQTCVHPHELAGADALVAYYRVRIADVLTLISVVVQDLLCVLDKELGVPEIVKESRSGLEQVRGLWNRRWNRSKQDRK